MEETIQRRLQFQSTHPRRVRQRDELLMPLSDLFQSTHPRRVRQMGTKQGRSARLMFQSTHPRRVRQQLYDMSNSIQQFQSTHPRRVRRRKRITVFSSWSFNPRTHEGCDLVGVRGLQRFDVSIHAPTKGATQLRGRMVCYQRFQSTHPRRVRHRHKSTNASLSTFQSTHPRRVRRSCPRGNWPGEKVSIHAPTKGATPESI